MEPIRGHESADDDRRERPGIKAPIPIESGSEKKTKKKSKAERPSPPEKTPAPEKAEKVEKTEVKHLLSPEGTLFQREPDEDKLQPAEKPAEVAPEPETEPAPYESEFAAEVDRQLALEVAEQEAAALAKVTPETPVEAAALEAEKELLTEIQTKVAEAEPEQAEAAIDSAYQEMIDSFKAEHAPEAAPDVVEADEPSPAPAAATESDSLRAARQAAEAAYRDSVETPAFHVPDLEGALRPQPESLLPPAPEPEPRRFFGLGNFLAGDHHGHRRGRQEGEAIGERRASTAKRGARQTVGRLQRIIRRREEQIAELEREHYIDEMALSAAQSDAEPYKGKGQEMLTMPLPENPFGPRPETAASPVPPLAEAPQPTLTAEALAAPAPERRVNGPVRSEQLSPNELATVAERIMVDGVTVRSMYEVGRFDQDSLRLIVDTYLRGGNVNQAVNQEVQRHDRLRYQRFETLNQAPAAGAMAAYGPPVPVLPAQPTAHGTIPAPKLPNQTDNAAVNPNQAAAGSSVKPDGSSSNLERIVLIISIILVIAASVVLIGLFARS